MKKHKLSVLGISLMLFITSCKKNDVLQQNISANKIASTNAVRAEWRSLSNWNILKENKTTTYTSKLLDSSLTADVAQKGIVLAFVKNNTGIQALPFQENGTSNSYWYYQISNDTISFSCDNYTGKPNLTTNRFTYFILSPQKLKNLESSGFTKIKVMQMSYDDIAKLLKK